MTDFDSRMAGSILMADIPPDSVAVDGMDRAQDSATVAYVMSIRPVFETVKHAAAQVAAFFVLATTGSRRAGPDHPLLTEARNAVRDATDGVRAAAGVTERAAHHHYHMLRAVAAIKSALSALQGSAWTKDSAALDLALHRLKAGWQELHWATAALPGFEMVQLSQSCCASHSFAMTVKRTNT